MYIGNINYFNISALVFFFAFNINCQAGTIDVSSFQHISTENGLSQKSIRKIFQDSSGFIWMGTQEGLNRYDGRNFTHFRHTKSNTASLSNDVIRDIVEDSEHNIWVATSGGLNRFDLRSEKFEQIIIKDQHNKQVLRLNTLYKDNDGKILIGTDGQGLFILDPSVKPYNITQFDFLPKTKVFDVRVIFKDSRDRYWIGTDGNGVWVKGKNNTPTMHFSHDDAKPTSLSHNRIRSILEDQKGQVWIGSRGGGLNRFDELSKDFKHYSFEENKETSLSNNRVYELFEDNNNNLWVGTDSGINIFQPESDDFKRIEYLPSQKYGLSHNRVLDIFEDEGGIIWIGTLAGINLWNPVTAKFVQYQHISERPTSLSNNTVSSFAETNHRSIYVSTFGGGLNIIDTKSLNISPVIVNENTNFKLHDSRLTTIMFDSKQRLWVGSATSGIRLFDKNLNIIKTFSHSKDDDKTISANGITDIYEDSDGEVWVATYGAGLNRYNHQNNSFKKYRYVKNESNSLSSDNIYQVFEGDEGYIWLATDGGGLSKLDKNTDEFVNFANQSNNHNSLSSNTAWSILQDSQGRFWIGTQGNGLNRWEPEDRRKEFNKFKHYNIENGLESSTINGVVEDENGYIWISTNKGVSRLDPESNVFKHYNLADEEHHNEFIQGSIHRSEDGRIYIGGINGVSAFYPKEIIENQHVPNILLTNIMSENRKVNFYTPLEQLKKVTFNHEDYLLTFEFAALDYSQPEKNQYQYKLEGFDPDWVSIGNLNRATYTNLPSGTYIFKVKGSNNDGLWSDESINLSVIIEPAPWASWWAFIIYATIFCISLIILIRSQAKRIANQELFQKKVSERIDSKTALYEKDNLSLKELIKNYQHNSGNDLATGLPNQSFFTEQLLISLDWLKNISQQSTVSELKLCCTILKLTIDNDDKIEDRLAALADQITTKEESIHLVARWNENELAMLCFVENKKQASELVGRICNYSSSDQQEKDEQNISKISLGYSLVPLHLNDQQSFMWENILMLTEHAMRSANKYDGPHYIGLLACHQKLSSVLIKEIMVSKDILKLKDMFDFDSNI